MSIKVNETPVRTSRNFLINNIKLDFDIPDQIGKFENIELEAFNESKTRGLATDVESYVVKDLDFKSPISKNVRTKKMTYGNGKLLDENVFKKANSKIRIETEKEDIKIKYEFDDNNLELVNQIEIIGNKDANIIIEYESRTENPCFHNGIIKTIAKKDCKLNIAIVNLLNDKSVNFEAIENELYENSKVKYTIIDLGGKTSISNYYSNILGEKADNDLKTIYLGKDNEIKDLNYIAELRGKNSKIDIDVQGALDGNCKKNFKGTIDFKKGCKKAKGNENEFCLLLSDKAKSIALPMLLCTEDDVEGNHSTASGKVDAKSLFYIMSRGLSYKEAVKLIVKSNFNKIIERIKDNEVKEEILKEIDRRLN